MDGQSLGQPGKKSTLKRHMVGSERDMWQAHMWTSGNSRVTHSIVQVMQQQLSWKSYLQVDELVGHAAGFVSS